jgi:hypothetical protein
MPNEPTTDANKTLVRALKQIDRDLVTARELIRGAIATSGQTVMITPIADRLKAALSAFEAAFKTGV